MKKNKLKISGLFIIIILIILSFVYTVNIKPVVYANNKFFCQIKDENYKYNQMSLKVYENFFNLLNKFSKFNFNYNSSLDTKLKN